MQRNRFDVETEHLELYNSMQNLFDKKMRERERGDVLLTKEASKTQE